MGRTLAEVRDNILAESSKGKYEKRYTEFLTWIISSRKGRKSSLEKVLYFFFPKKFYISIIK